ncbi:MAG: hypothetical protein ACJ76T_12765, partial [Solirubrobacteraceae bacterium]
MPLFGGDRESGPRTAAEREAARLERERRRAEREGRSLPEAPVDDGTGGVEPPEPEPEQRPEPEAEHHPEAEPNVEP